MVFTHIRLDHARCIDILLNSIVEHIVLIKHLDKMGVRFLRNKKQHSPRTGIAISRQTAISTLIVSVIISDRMIINGALASIRMVNMYAICTFVISVVSLVTRLDVEK